jgi:hypothetical protein
MIDIYHVMHTLSALNENIGAHMRTLGSLKQTAPCACMRTAPCGGSCAIDW